MRSTAFNHTYGVPTATVHLPQTPCEACEDNNQVEYTLITS